MGNGDEMKESELLVTPESLTALAHDIRTWQRECEDDDMRTALEREMRWLDDGIARELSTMPANAFEAQARIGAVNDLRARRAEAAHMVAAWGRVTT